MIYTILASFFVASDVLTNLVFGKFLGINLFNIINIEIPAGSIIYPFTFLISDLITEIYNKTYARRVVISSFFSIFFVSLLLQIIDRIPAASFSIISNDEFHKVFSLSLSAFCASSVAYLVSQLLDIQIYHTLKRMTSDKYLWLRNFLSISISQVVDTTLFLSIVMLLGVIAKESYFSIFFPMICIKIIWAVFEIPFFYLGVYSLRYLKNKFEDNKATGTAAVHSFSNIPGVASKFS